MSQFDYDLFVIGAGSGGVRAARLASTMGARVAVAEESRVGGTCVIRGCVPKKFMVYASEFARDFDIARGYGWTIPEASFSWPDFLAKKDMEIARLSGIYTSNLKNAGADLFDSHARFVDPHTIELTKEGRTVTAERVLIAVGGRPRLPDDLPGAEHAITSDEAFELTELPKRIVIVGGGYIAVEFANIFHGLGVDVTLVYRGSNLLRGFDEDVRAQVAENMSQRGLKVMLACQHQSIERRPDGVLLSHVSPHATLESEQVMFAVGREPHVKGLGLDAAGVALNDKGAVAVDRFSQTNVPHIFAVGDVTDRLNLTPVAIREAAAFAETVYRDRPTAFDHRDVATAVFSQPPVGTVGMSEAEARHAFRKVDIYLARFRPMKTIFVGENERVLMKLVVDGETDRVLGCHIVGPDAPEIIQMVAIAVKAGLTKHQFDDTCALHPTIGEELVTLREKYVPQELQAAE